MRSVPECALGFVYLITAPNGMKYIGKKLFTSARKRAPLKGTKRVRRDRVESKWRDYFGSSRELQEELARTGPQGWRREILHLCTSKWELAWLELKEQLDRNVLVDESYFNSIIHVRLSVRKTFRPPPRARH